MDKHRRTFLFLIFLILLATPCLATAATIDSTTISQASTYNPGGNFYLFGTSDEYFLSDGTSWVSGAGSKMSGMGNLQSIEISDNIIKYTFNPPTDGILYSQTDYDAGDHSSQGVLGVAGPLVLKAEIGSTTATMTGYVEIISNDVTSYGEPKFNYFSVGVGGLVKYSMTYTLTGAAWTENLFDTSFSYGLSGYVDFSPPSKGDINADGYVDLQDSIIALQVISKMTPAVKFYPSSDVGGDSKIGLAEAIYAIQWAAGLYNNAPELEPIGNKTVDENSTITFTIAATDPDRYDNLTYTANNLPAGATFNPATRTFSWTPTYTQGGTYEVTFVVEDNYKASDSETVTITVNDIPVFIAPEYFPLNIGDWWDYKDSTTGNILRTSVSGTKSINGVETKIVSYPDGTQEYYTSDANGLQLYGIYMISADYTGAIIFNTPLLLMPNYAVIGSEQVSSSNYSVTIFVEGYGNVTVHVDITSTNKVLLMEDVQTGNTVLADCIKVSGQYSEYINETGETWPGDVYYDWLLKGVGLVKRTSNGATLTLHESFVGGIHQNY